MFVGARVDFTSRVCAILNSGSVTSSTARKMHTQLDWKLCEMKHLLEHVLVKYARRRRESTVVRDEAGLQGIVRDWEFPRCHRKLSAPKVL